MVDLLGTIGRRGRWCLILGLIAGLALPGLALTLKPWLPEMIAALLFLAALRIGPRAAVGGLTDLRRTAAVVAVYQLAGPILVLAVLLAMGVANQPWALALVLVLAAPPVTGSPNFTVLLGADPSAAMRVLLIGTAVFPLTSIPVLMLLPGVDTVADVLAAALRLLAVIGGAVGIAFGIRAWAWPLVSDDQRGALDGASAILLGVVVVGLMAAAGPALTGEPVRFALWLGFAFVVNFGAQAMATRFLPATIIARDRPGTALTAGNRNIALFLVALPEATTDAILLFIGCYQIPMYLTPILMRRLLTARGLD